LAHAVLANAPSVHLVAQAVERQGRVLNTLEPRRRMDDGDR
jgi:hypothetical protein